MVQSGNDKMLILLAKIEKELLKGGEYIKLPYTSKNATYLKNELKSLLKPSLTYMLILYRITILGLI